MQCPECGTRKARRACPALHRDICAVCCATKRLREIACPRDCPYLVSARQHPAAVQLRQQQRDLARIVELLRDFSEAQARLFLLINRFLLAYRPPDLHRLVDEDVAAATDALAATYETASKGVIYEHSTGSVPAERLLRELKPFLRESAGTLGELGKPPSDHDVVGVLRRLSDAVLEEGRYAPGQPRAYLALLERVLRDPAEKQDEVSPGGEGSVDASDARAGTRLILP